MSPRKKNDSRLPIFLSMAVYPGAGQIYQGRWFAAFFFAFGFTVFFVLFGYFVYRILAVYFALGFDDISQTLSGAPARAFRGPALIAVGVAMLFYVGGIVDTVLATARASRRAAVPPPLPPMDADGS